MIFETANASVLFNHVRITGNAAQVGGGGGVAAIFRPGASASFVDSVISGNTSVFGGGGVGISGGSISLTNTSITGNSVRCPGGTCYSGGGLWLQSASAVVSGSKITNNQAPLNGGGIAVQGAPGYPAGVLTVTETTRQATAAAVSISRMRSA